MNVRVASVFLACTLATGAACESKSSKPDAANQSQATERVRFESERAPYGVKLPPGWTLESDDALNKHADLKASKENSLFVIVIPQRMPQVEGVDTPGVQALKEASIDRMRKNVDSLRIEREGPVTLESGEALSVFAEGKADGNPVQYVATYVTRGAWGYQIVAWGPVDAESQLVDSVDRIIRGWQFTSESLPSGAADARSGDSSKQSED